MLLEPSMWTLLQILIDCLLIFLILFLLVVLYKERKQRLLLKQWILKQTRVFRDLVQTSDEKAETLSRSVESLIHRLSREIAAAQTVLETLERVSEEKESSSTHNPSDRPPVEREAIRYLLKKGMKPLEISRELHLPIGEVELVSKMESDQRFKP